MKAGRRKSQPVFVSRPGEDQEAASLPLSSRMTRHSEKLLPGLHAKLGPEDRSREKSPTTSKLRVCRLYAEMDLVIEPDFPEANSVGTLPDFC